MCNFLSAIVTRDGTILHHWAIDLHSELIAHFGLNEGGRAVAKDQNFIRVEMTPGLKADDHNDYANPEGYALNVDECFTPEWFTADMRTNVDGFLRGQIERMIVRDKRALLVGGCWIIADGAEVGATHSARLFHVGGTIQRVDGGTIQRVDGGTIQYVYGGTIQCVYGGTIQRVVGGTIKRVVGGTIVEDLRPKQRTPAKEKTTKRATKKTAKKARSA